MSLLARGLPGVPAWPYPPTASHGVSGTAGRPLIMSTGSTVRNTHTACGGEGKGNCGQRMPGDFTSFNGAGGERQGGRVWTPGLWMGETQPGWGEANTQCGEIRCVSCTGEHAAAGGTRDAGPGCTWQRAPRLELRLSGWRCTCLGSQQNAQCLFLPYPAPLPFQRVCWAATYWASWAAPPPPAWSSTRRTWAGCPARRQIARPCPS